MALPTNIDTTYADDGSDASVKLHQQYHDTVHGAVNALAGGTTGQVWQKTGSADYEASWGTPGFGSGEFLTAGEYSHGMYYTGTMATISLAVGQMRSRPFVVMRRRAFDRIGITVQTAATAASGGVLRLGIYANSGGKPGALIVDGSTVSSESVGTKEVTITQTLDPGVYWLAVACQVSACSVYSYSNGILPFVSIGANPPGSSMTGGGFLQSSVTGALPDPASGSVSVTAIGAALRAA